MVLVIFMHYFKLKQFCTSIILFIQPKFLEHLLRVTNSVALGPQENSTRKPVLSLTSLQSSENKNFTSSLEEVTVYRGVTITRHGEVRCLKQIVQKLTTLGIQIALLVQPTFECQRHSQCQSFTQVHETRELIQQRNGTQQSQLIPLA